MMYECEMLLKCIFVLENKSFPNVGELWEVKSQTAVGDEEYAHLQTLFRILPPGIPILLLEEKSAGEDWLWLEKSLWRMLFSAWGKVFRSFSFPLLY